MTGDGATPTLMHLIRHDEALPMMGLAKDGQLTESTV